MGDSVGDGEGDGDCDAVGVAVAVGLGRAEVFGGTELAANRTAIAPPTVTRMSSANTRNAAARPAAPAIVAGRPSWCRITVMLS